MKILRSFLLSSGFVSSVAFLSAQQIGGNPPSIKWKQVNTDTVRVIFPAGLEKQAMDITTIIHQLAEETQFTIGEKLKKIDIVLQNQTTISNGFVTLGPFHSEFYLTPEQNSFTLGSLPSHKLLALHEYRHVQQYNNFNKGLSKVFYYLFGEEGESLANSIAIPNWFWEGDAVFQETYMSGQGRGRLPYFYNDFRALWAAERKYSWMKLRNGSLRDAIPDHYRLGFQLTAYGRIKYGPEIWKKITDDASRFRGLFYPFQKAVKKYTGEKYQLFHEEAFQYFRAASPEKKDKDFPSAFAASHIHFVADEEYPQWIDSNRIIYVKSSFKKIPAFYIRDIVSGKEMQVRIKDISLDNYFSYKNGRVVYAAFEPDPRWNLTDYSNIRILDLGSGKQKVISRHSKYFAPDISEDGNQIVAVHVDPNGHSALHLLSAVSGKIEKVIPNSEHLFFTYPKFYGKDKIVAAVRNEKGEMGLGLFEIANGRAEWLLPFSSTVIGFLSVNMDTITFTASNGNLDKLYSVIKKKIYQYIPQSENFSTGNYQWSVHDGKSVWSSFTAVGFHIFQERLLPGQLTEIEPDSLQAPMSSYQLESSAQHRDLSILPSFSYPVSGYSKSFKLINFHSWRPYISDPDYSFSLVGQNILNTFQSELFFSYNRNEHYKETGGLLSYGGWFPVINGEVAYTWDRNFRDSLSTTTWNELNASAGITLPLNFTSGRYYRILSVSGNVNTKQVYYSGSSKLSNTNKQFNFGDISISFINQVQQARQHIYPRFAQTLFLEYESILNKFTARQFLFNGNLFLPGLFINHSLVINASYQGRDTLQQYNFSNNFPFSRGYSSFNLPRMWKIGFNYHFPIVYPDWGFGNILYVLRLRGNVFYDETKTKSLRSGKIFPFRTTGAELYFDTKWWNQLPVSFGLRYSHLLDPDLLGRSSHQWEFILPLTLLSKNQHK